ncbi:hypothetical protein T439DRAFT_329916 [Meredithblackwellia eburnea MCA 4105]
MPPKDLARSLQRTLTHLEPPPRKGGKFGMPIPTHFRPNPKFVPVKDRIPFWHIAPNDSVVVVKGDDRVRGATGTVEKVDRETNRVWLKQSDFQFKKRIASQYPGEVLSPDFKDPNAFSLAARPFHISNVRLQARKGAELYTVSRMRRTAPTWDRNNNRFHWKRFGLVRQLATGEGETGWVEIPFPREEGPAKVTAGPLDATGEDTFALSWTPSTPSSSSLPPELDISRLDLSGGPHSRAARTKRFNEKKREAKEWSKLKASERRGGFSLMEGKKIELA